MSAAMLHTLICCLLLSSLSSALINIGLDGIWHVINKEKAINITGTVPGSMYTALLNNKVIQDPYYRDNDVKYRWIGRTDWTYTRTFTVSAEVLQKKSVLLVSDGLDTVATVLVNNKVVGTASNMFLHYIFDIKSALMVGSNTITVDFKSAVNEAASRAKNLTYDIPPDCPAAVQNGECHVNLLRKEQCSFSWDWGPSFPTQGIWKHIYIQAFDTAVIHELTALPHKNSDGSWNLEVEVDFGTQSTQLVKGELSVSLPALSIKAVKNISLSSLNKTFAFIIAIPKTTHIDLWWPNGYGNQTLYSLNATFQAAAGGDTSSTARRVGFRTVELVQNNVSTSASQGQTFYFKINDVPVFFKGTNWIPADSFQERITRDRLNNLLKSAADVHINSMRVWGGGVYESRDFYELADQYGIMIWQDFMFSVALYPATHDFLAAVAEEITYQVRRLKHHPSIAVWAGNNENESGLRDNWFRVKNFTLYYNDYVALYAKTILPIVKAADTTRKYLTSSPSDGDETEREGWVAKNPSSELWGDIHYYDYSVNQWDPNNFRIPRFTSEFGVQAWCSIGALQGVFTEADMDYSSAMALHRQHHGNGNNEMKQEFQIHFNLPNNTNKKQLFIDLIYLTQVNQAMSIRTQSEHYRRWQAQISTDGRGMTMGALYWQLNDIWQAPTWASLEYSGKWKLLHYFAQHFFAPILVSPYVDKAGNLEVFVVVDEIPAHIFRDQQTKKLHFEPVHDVSSIEKLGMSAHSAQQLNHKVAAAIAGTITLSVFSWSSFTPLKTWTIPYSLKSTAESVFNRSLTALIADAKCPGLTSCFIQVSSNATSSPPTWLPLSTFKTVQGLTKAHIKVTGVKELSSTEFTVTLSTDHVAPFVWIDAGTISGRFGDNGFLMSTPTQTVSFHAWAPTTADKLQQALTVMSLMDVY